MTPKQQAEAELIHALKGCPSCDYDEAEGGLVCHCDKCCFRVTTYAWRWANTLNRTKRARTV